MTDIIKNEIDFFKNEIPDSESDNKVSIDIVVPPPTGNSLFLDENDQTFLNESSVDSNIDIYPGVKLRLTFLNMSENSGHCSKCSRDFDLIKNHKNIYHRRKKEKWCEICGRLFSKVSKFHEHLNEHQSVNYNDKKECYICQIEFDDVKEFKKHLEQHSCLHVHLCGTCSKTFMFYDNYANHLRSVHNEEPPAINTAELSFDDIDVETLLDLHEKSLDDEASPIFRKKTTEDNTSTVLDDNAMDDDTENTKGNNELPNLHEETMDESFVNQDSNSFCFKCNRNFADFKSHEYIFHRNKNQIVCELCGRQFYKNKRYESHKIEHKNNKIKCYVCKEKNFDSFRSFMKHLECHDELHVYFCSICSESFATKLIFDRHLKKRHDNQSKNDTVIEISPDKSESIDKNTDFETITKIQFIDNNLTNDTIDIAKSGMTIIGEDESNELTPLDLIKRLKGKEKNEKKTKKKERKVELYYKEKSAGLNQSIKNSPDESVKKHDESQFDDEDLDFSLLDQSVDQVCYVCGEKFVKNSRCNVFNHWFIEHNDYSHCCKICDKRISKLHHLYFHSMKHDDKYPWPCSKCDIKCKNYFALRDHVTWIHKKIENYVCKICDQKFIFPFTYSCHRRTHNDKWQFKCQYCPKQVHWKRILIPHLKRRRCKYCDIDLPCRTLYDEHFRNRHMNEKLFDCKYCNAVYPTKAKLKQHHTVKHLDLVTKKIEYCNYCEFMTNTRRNLNKHVRTAHLAK